MLSLAKIGRYLVPVDYGKDSPLVLETMTELSAGILGELSTVSTRAKAQRMDTHVC